MDKIRTFFNKNKYDVINIIALSVFFVFVFLVKFNSCIFLVDIGREIYVPKLILQGKILYKDVFMMHTPLSYQLNALWYYLFGASFGTLRAVSWINIYLVMILTYFVSREFLKPLLSFVSTIFIQTVMIFSSMSILNWIYPYSYGLTYSVSMFLLFVLFVIKYVKSADENWNVPSQMTKYAHLSALFLGLAFAFKQEFSILYIPFFLLLLKINWKSVFVNILCFILPSAFSWGILFLQGLKLDDVFSYLGFLNTLVRTKSWYIYTFWEDAPVATQIVVRLKYSAAAIVVSLCFFMLNIKFIKDAVRNFPKNSLKNYIGLIFLFIIDFNFLSLLYHKIVMFRSVLNLPLPFLCLFKYKRGDKDTFLFTFFTVLCYLITIREIFIPYSYSIYLCILPAVLILSFIFQSNLKEETKKAVWIFLLIFSLLLIPINLKRKEEAGQKVYSKIGSFYMMNKNAEVYNYIISWIEQNTQKTDRVLVLPEAPVINFVTGRPTNNRYYQLSPDHIEAFGEKQIVDDLKKDLPEYIVLQKIDYYVYGESILGKDFGEDLMKLIKQHYTFVTNAHKGEYFYAIVLKRK